MALSRRGFLGSMLTAAVGSTTLFDPIAKLWLPSAEAIVLADAGMVQQQVEANALALRFAHAMGDRLSGNPSLVLHEVMLRAAGHLNLGLIEVEGQGTGRFEPTPFRLVKTLRTIEWESKELFSEMLGQLRSDLGRYQIDALAPVSGVMRAGEPFTDAVVSMATDPESGISARAIAFTQADGKSMTSVELAIGRWRSRRRDRARGNRYNWMGA